MRKLAIVVACALGVVATPGMAQVGKKAAPKAGPALSIRVLSSKPQFVSGGDALVEVRGGGPGGKLWLNGQDVSSALKAGPKRGSRTGLVTGMKAGANTLSASVGMAKVTLAVTNHPITGPILSGPHMKPYECRTEESGLGKALDANCSAAERADWFYRTKGGAFKPLTDRNARPDDLATTTTIEGVTVPYIVKVESGTINRTIYRIAALEHPKGWNGRLAVSFGGGAGAKYNQGTNDARAPLSDLFLSRGFAHMVATELVNNLHGNAVLQGETLMMLKEHFIERYGVPKWTVGSGGSGGAIQQLLITQMYPGLLDGLQPSLAFPDSTLHTPDCGLIQRYWRSDAGKGWSQAKKSAVEGFYPNTCAAWERSFVPVARSGNKPGCDLKDASLVWDRETNPKGARCAQADMRVNVYGRDPTTGYARRTEDNVGLQYGLKGLNDGVLSVDEFLDINEKIGGYDDDGEAIATRSVGDPVAIRAAYGSGLLDGGGGGLANVPILNFRGYTDSASDIHSRERDLSIRARLAKANGDAANQVIWVGPGGRPGQAPDAAAASGRANLSALALDAMTRWLDAMAADPAPLSHAKVVRHKPAEAVDAWFDDKGVKHVERARWNGKGGFNTTYPVHLEPRLVAGAPPANDILKCQLKPPVATDYKATFTPAQWSRLKAVFPGGVCDFKKPGVGQTALKGTYQRY